jgi:prefoldin subunit 1
MVVVVMVLTMMLTAMVAMVFIVLILTLVLIQILNEDLYNGDLNPRQVYESAGRMFLLSDIKAVRAGLDRKNDAVKEKVQTLVSNKEYLEKQIKESENNLRELVMAKKNNS